jgi:CheY-like chemotaxis protein
MGQYPSDGARRRGSGVLAGPLHRASTVSKRILVVDDMQYLRDIQVLLLNDAGYAATAIGSAREALQRLPEVAPDLILLDVSMPGMDGRQFLSRLRATPEWRHVPVVLTTGRAAEEVARESGCDVLCKPFTEKAMLELVRRLVGD